MLWYNHRPIIADQLRALVSLHQQNVSYIDEAKLMVKEFLRFGVHPVSSTARSAQLGPHFPLTLISPETVEFAIAQLRSSH